MKNFKIGMLNFENNIYGGFMAKDFLENGFDDSQKELEITDFW